MSHVDDITLSSYLDGELDYYHAEDVTDRIHYDSATRDRLASLAAAQALLKSFARSRDGEASPERLVGTLRRRKHHRLFSLRDNRFVQAAAVFLLLLGSFLLGRNDNSGAHFQTSAFPVIPASLEQTISTVLEYERSGSTQEWVNIDKDVSARVTPVRSFRGGQGEFYRMFVVDMMRSGSEEHFWGMAKRSGKESWQTRGIFASDKPGNI